jgi:uncharacterized protein YqgC (DUF456 family)
MDTLLNVIASASIIAGLAGAVVPALPGIPLIFAGIWVVAGIDHYHHLGLWWLLGIAIVGAVGMILDLLAGPIGHDDWSFFWIARLIIRSIPRRPSRRAGRR